jgi:hypothetical protein
MRVAFLSLSRSVHGALTALFPEAKTSFPEAETTLFWAKKR